MTTLVQSVQRCLRILEFLNVRNGATVKEVCDDTGLTRGTVYRLLETLRHEGHLRKDAGSARYWLAARVQALSDGYQQEWWIDKFAKRIIEALGEKTKWPTKLLTLSGHEMLTRVTTDYTSPYTYMKFPSGMRLDLLTTAAGLVTLAFSDDADRAILLKLCEEKVQKRKRTQATPPKPQALEKDLNRIQREGYEIHGATGTSQFTLAVPVISDHRLIGVIAMHFFRSVVKRDDVIKVYLPQMQASAEEIGTTFAASRAKA